MTEFSKSVRAEPRARKAACSFDVFDTFLLRACTTPPGVYERAFQLSPISRSHATHAQTYVQHRIKADHITRARANDRRQTFEVNIEEIYSNFPFRLFGLDRSALPALVDAEFRAELDLCRVNDEILQLYLREQASGQRVGFISDTYWGEERISTLLRNLVPDLTWDFLYASCDYGKSKSDGLFARYLSGQRIDPTTATHIGDNPEADIKSARKNKIRPRFYPQASRPLAALFDREAATYNLLCNDQFQRLDGGYRTLRRIVSARLPERSAAFRLGLQTIGPSLMSFDHFLANRIARLQSNVGKVAIAFLGRDGFLSHRIWQTKHDGGEYLEISRRVALIASATKLEPLIDLFNKIADERVDGKIFFDILKTLPPSVAKYFAQQPGRSLTGHDLAKVLPFIICENEIAKIATSLRKSMLSYLESKVGELKDIDDLIVVDMGYSGSIQKSLRKIFDIEKIDTRIHGLYVSTNDEAFCDLDERDTAEGFISDLVLNPHVKRMFNRNIAMIEQMCCSPTGSVLRYGSNNEVFYESDTRSKEQIATVLEIQDGALVFVEEAYRISEKYRIEAFSDLALSARWTAATLSRMLFLPSDEELRCLGSFHHDINLGSQSTVSMVDRRFVTNIETARGLTAACMAPAPPMWLAGSFASRSTADAYLHMLFGANRLPASVFGETKCATLQIGLFAQDGAAQIEPCAVYRSGQGDLRIRIPLAQTMKLDTIAIPLGKITTQGILKGLTVQHGRTAQAASDSNQIDDLPLHFLTLAGFERQGRHFQATSSDACAILKIGSIKHPVAIITVAISPIEIVAESFSDEIEEFDDHLKTALLNING